MDSPQTSNSQSASTTSLKLNRRSLLKGSATFAATAVAGTTLGLLNGTARAEQPKPTTPSGLHAWEDFPGGV
jgi:hypothetical protein